MADEDASDMVAAGRPERPRPNAVADPDWGKSSYKPTRRANCLERRPPRRSL